MLLAFGVLAALGAGCQSDSLAERAVRARGGVRQGLILMLEAQVYQGFPGRWEYERVFVPPDLYAWKIETSAAPLYHLYDGATVRSFVGDAEVGSDASPGAPLRTHARWLSVVSLAAFAAAGVAIAPLAGVALPEGVREGLSVAFADGAAYRLGFDGDTRLVWAQGPVDLLPIGAGELSAHYSDFRPVGDLRLPFSASYALAGKPLADETVRAACLLPAGLAAASFAAPAHLPTCEPAEG